MQQVNEKSGWKGRSLENYKEMHKETADRNGVIREFLAARTLTQARKILFGEKKKQYVEHKVRGSNKWK